MPALQFQHPTLAGPGNFGGWFEEKVLGKQNAPVVEVPKPKIATGAKTFTMEEVAKHSTKDDIWIVVKDKVYDATKYLDDHPGGAASILIGGGQDVTDEFEALHSSKAWKLLEEFYIGDVADTPSGSPPLPPAATVKQVEDVAPVALQKGKWVTLPLEEKEVLSHDTRRFRFSLPSKMHELGLPTAQHLFIKLKDAAGANVMRAYTPLGHGPGYVDFVIKVYFANVHPRFPDGGKLTQLLDEIKVGDTIDVKGPLGEYIFSAGATLPNGLPRPADAPPLFTHTPSGEKTPFTSIGFIAGGSGITPVLQTATALVSSPQTRVEIWILYANRTQEDILCRNELAALEKDSRVKIWYTLDVKPEGEWPYSIGFINEEMVRERLPPPAEQTVIFMCGPPPMINFACKPNLEKAGHAQAALHCF